MYLRRLLARFGVDRESIIKTRGVGWLGQRLNDPEIWHLGRRSVAGGASLGLFLAFIPLPVQMLIAAPTAIALRVNLTVTIACVWITNPLTMAPIFLFAFKIGTWLMGAETNPGTGEFEISFASMTAVFREIWKPLIIGCFVCGLSASAVGNLAVRWLWRLQLIYRRNKRRNRPN
jgi:uncharacterized protein (DUF2062 family)